MAVVPSANFQFVENAAYRYGGRLSAFIGQYQADNADDYKRELKQPVICNHAITTFAGSGQPRRLSDYMVIISYPNRYVNTSDKTDK